MIAGREAMDCNVTYTDNSARALDSAVARLNPAGVFVVADTNSFKYVAESLMDCSEALHGAVAAIVEAGEEHKTLDAAQYLWRRMVESGVTRRWVVVNIGGGVVTDLGGFSAATFKRGVPFINLPTTVLGAVDAAVGGKTGVDFAGLKNEIGVFASAQEVIVTAEWFATLPRRQLLSGYGEMLKHALLDGPDLTARTLSVDFDDRGAMQELLRENVELKRRVVLSDPFESGPRKQLNLGHTVGHAFEMLSMENSRPVSHGHAVAQGIVTALVMSKICGRLQDSDVLYAVAERVRELYGPMVYSCRDYDRLLELMAHDKKNADSGHVCFTLLDRPGAPEWNNPVSADDIRTALDITADLLT